MITLIGLIAAFLTTISFIPQAVKTIKTKDNRGISFTMYLIFTIGVALWLIYGFVIKDLPLFIANSVTLLFVTVILICKITNIVNDTDK